jgi:hypothetical protein
MKQMQELLLGEADFTPREQPGRREVVKIARAVVDFKSG